MLLRPYQKRLVDRAVKALADHGNTLAVAATGAGKTICLSAIGKAIDGKTLVLQHRHELVQQNCAKYRAVNPKTSIGLWTADKKTFRSQTTFAMVQSLVGHLSRIPKLDLIIADEAHHIAAPTWSAIIEAAREKNPDVMLAGFTATPSRSDRKGLRRFFDNVCDNITIRELVSLGFLVPPRAFVIDTAGTRERLASLRTCSDFGEQHDVEAILNTDAVNAEVIRNWREHADGRPTVVFCSTVAHAEDVATAFTRAGIPAACVHGGMSVEQRTAILNSMTAGKTQVITNCMILTEGWDYQPVSCVILLRQCSDKSPLIQMVGRGLRTVDHKLYPGVIKKDCVVMDFGQSLLVHGNLIADAGLGDDGSDRIPNPALAPKKICPTEYRPGMTIHFPDSEGKCGCGAEVPSQVRVCPLCGFRFEPLGGEQEPLQHVDLTEMDILDASPFRYCDLFGNGSILMATGFEAWAGIMTTDAGDTWHALGKQRTGEVEELLIGSRLQAMAAADDYLRNFETETAARKTRRWLDDPASEKQIELLNRMGYNLQPDLLGQTMSKYAAMCHLGFQFDRRGIERVLGVTS